jgi:hypothetical protein
MRRRESRFPPWLAELWQMTGSDPPENPREGLAELRQWLAKMRSHLADLEQRLEAWARSEQGAEDESPSAA